MLNPNGCSCSLDCLQRLGDQLERESLPVDKILHAGSEFTSQLQRIIECDTCILTKRVSVMLPQITLRLICFYEAVYGDTVENLSSNTSSSGSSSHSEYMLTARKSPHAGGGSPNALATQRQSTCKSIARNMKLGEMPIDGIEGRLLVRVVLVEACLELNENVQEWKNTMEESFAAEHQQYLAQYNASIGRCLDRLANLIGLLRLDPLSTDRS